MLSKLITTRDVKRINYDQLHGTYYQILIKCNDLEENLEMIFTCVAYNLYCVQIYNTTSVLHATKRQSTRNTANNCPLDL